MFITFKNTSSVNDSGMKPVISQSANPRGTNSRLRSTRKAACVACQTRKLSCSGGTVCNRCKASGIACVFSQQRRPQHRRVDEDLSVAATSSTAQAYDNAGPLTTDGFGLTFPQIPTEVDAQLYYTTYLSPPSEVADADLNQYLFDHGINVNLDYRVDTTLPNFNEMTVAMLAPSIGSTYPASSVHDSEDFSPKQNQEALASPSYQISNDSTDSMPQLPKNALPPHILNPIADPHSHTSSDKPRRSEFGDDPCDCINRTIRVVQRLDDDEFHLTTLPLDQVLQLQKWLIYQCCMGLNCSSCARLLAVHTVVLVICERLSEMFECIHKRIRRATEIIIGSPLDRTGNPMDASTGVDASETGSNSTGHAPAQLFDGTSGGASRDSVCNPMMFSGQVQDQYSKDEQIHLIQVLLRFQIRSFSKLLDRMGDLPLQEHSVARSTKVTTMITRLKAASTAIDAALQVALRFYDSV